PQPILDGIGSKQIEERQHDPTELLDGDVGNEALRTLRQMDSDDGATLHAKMVERVGKAARGLLDLAKAPDPDIAIGLLIDQRRRVRSRPGMPAADRLGNVETGRDLPPEGVIDLLRSEEHTSELQSRENLVCRLLLEKKKKTKNMPNM